MIILLDQSSAFWKLFQLVFSRHDRHGVNILLISFLLKSIFSESGRSKIALASFCSKFFNKSPQFEK